MSACKLVTVKKKISLFKGEEQANSIELIELEEVGNSIVSQIGLYQVGDKAIFIEPDYCLPDTSLFESFNRPNGDESKSKLGKQGRIKAIKFNLHVGDGLPVYSYGILRPLDLVKTWLKENGLNKEAPYEILLGIIKYEEPDDTKANLGGGSKSMPEGMYKTDETNINNLWKQIQYPITLIGTQKIDGSSITLYSRYNNKDERISGICSRNYEKPLTIKKKHLKDFDSFPLSE